MSDDTRDNTTTPTPPSGSTPSTDPPNPFGGGKGSRPLSRDAIMEVAPDRLVEVVTDLSERVGHLEAEVQDLQEQE